MPRPPVRKTCFHRTAAVEADIGFCAAVRYGNTLRISGTVGRGDMPDAMRMAYGSLLQTLQAHGLSFADVVSETVFTTDIDGFIEHKDVRKAFYGQHFPAATWVQVQRLYSPAFVVEIELTVIFGSS